MAIFQARNGIIEAGLAEGLQQIVECADIKSPQCMLIIRSCEYDIGLIFRLNSFQNVKTINFWHFYVEEHNVRALSADHLDRRTRICALANAGHEVIRSQEL